MNLRAVLVVILLVLVGFCQFSNCNAQSDLNLEQSNTNSNTHFLFEAPKLSFNEIASENGKLFSYSKATKLGGVEFSLNLQSVNNYSTNSDLMTQSIGISNTETLVRPQITLFSSSSTNLKPQSLNATTKSIRSDRYKNTIPAIYRLTLKGYSIMEHSDNQTLAWTLNKVDNKELRKPQLMLSFTKNF